MKKTTILPLSLVLAASLLTGCVIVDGDSFDDKRSKWRDIERENRQKIDGLSKGARVEEVMQRMGVADFNELFEKSGQQYQVLYYRTQLRDSDGITTKDECTPVVFKAGVLMGWGQSALTYL